VRTVTSLDRLSGWGALDGPPHRILIDCSLLHIGGGIQVGLAVLRKAAETPGVHWSALVSEEVDRQLPSDRGAFHHYGIARRLLKPIGNWLPPRGLRAFAARVRAEVVFTVFGPPYERVDCAHLVGLAVGRLLYPEVHLPKHAHLVARLQTSVRDYAVRRRVTHGDYFVVETPVVKERLASMSEIAPSRIFVVPNGCSPAFLSRLRETTAVSNAERFRILVPSGYYPHKNLEVIPMVANILRERGHDQFEFVLTLGQETAQWRDLVASARRFGVERHLVTAGVQRHAEIARLYAGADATFLPSLVECSTAVYPESFAAEVPVVTSDRDFARVGCADAALYFDPLDPPSAAVQIERLMLDGSLRTELAARGKLTLKMNYLSPEEKWGQQLNLLLDIARAFRQEGSADRRG
jgi:glycosyltransferase involved in cell wall biosynthesis